MEEVGSNMKEFLFVTQGYLKAVGPSRSWAVSEWRPGRRKKKSKDQYIFLSCYSTHPLVTSMMILHLVWTLESPGKT